MLTRDENELLARVGPGTPMGNLLRRYWHPVAARAEMASAAESGRWTKRVRILGEDLVLFADRSGALGLIGEACPHRRASLAYGIPASGGIRCPYHGWMFDAMGRCIDQPNEPAGSNFKDKIAHAGYPVQELAGVVFAYLGPLPAPLLPRLDGYVAAPAIHMLGSAVIPCNWLQIMENTVDPVHSEWLHGHFQEFMCGDGSRASFIQRHLKIAFDEVPYGIIKRRLKEGQPEDCSDWRVGHPLVFPNYLALGNAQGDWRTYEFQIRVPIDDENTRHFWYVAFVPPAGTAIPEHLTAQTFAYDVPPGGEDEYAFDMSDHQDVMAWTTQGAITDRTQEHLGSTDRGVTLYRRMLLRELRKVEAGEDPMLTIRDPAQDAVLELPAEHDKAHFSAGFEAIVRRRSWRHSPVAEDVIALYRATSRPATTAPA
jgi:5,5'-dehydrodivanillate O-demethylase